MLYRANISTILSVVLTENYKSIIITVYVQDLLTVGGIMKTIISASILSADFTHLGEDIKRAQSSGVDMIHFDVMDGIFVPNISFGIPVLKCVRKFTDMVIDVHLMIHDPIRYISEFAENGADIITIHSEAGSDIDKTLDLIHKHGKKAGLSIKPGTSVESILPYLEKVDMVLVMTVEPGFGGQGFIDYTLEKISALRQYEKELGLSFDIQVDGGINDSTAVLVKQKGANNLVSGSYLFAADNMSQCVAKLKQA